MRHKKFIWKAILYFTVVCIIAVCYIKFYPKTIEKAGTTGDAFNGLIAPFISFAAALLVYLSFKEQIKANEIITSQWQFDTYLKLYTSILDELNQINIIHWIQIPGNPKDEKVQGSEAFNLIIENGIGNNTIQGAKKAIEKLNSVAAQFTYFIKALKQTDFPQKNLLVHKIIMFYFNNMEDLANKLEKESSKVFPDDPKLEATYRSLRILDVEIRSLGNHF